MSCYTDHVPPNPPRVWTRLDTLDRPCIDPMLAKGNVLQYRPNMQSQTKANRYSKLAQRLGPNRTTTWASYTNPNTRNLPRYFVSGTANGGTANRSESAVNTGSGQVIPPSIVANGGYLLGSVSSNQGLKTGLTPTMCAPTTSSNVPGPIVPLCWATYGSTWVPKKPMVFGHGGKWPNQARLQDGAPYVLMLNA